jgi:dipeptidyl aminopeptidase/acylaminoacyl peptidase
MFKRFIIIFILICLGTVGLIIFIKNQKSSLTQTLSSISLPNLLYSPLQISVMRERVYPGSPITIEQELAPGSNYKRYLASYLSDGLKIYALLTVPNTKKPPAGFPAIIFNHGYIPPETYKTTERYVAYVDGFAKAGFIVFKPDYRGNGNSEGNPEGAYYSPAYTTDVLNAVASIKQYQDADPNHIGMWGHSMGGNLTLRAMVISHDIKAGVIWGGVVGDYGDLINNWRRSRPFQPSEREQASPRLTRQQLIQQFGNPLSNNSFWRSISPYSYLNDISGPIELHHGLADEEVPWEFSQNLYNALKAAGKTAEFYTYEGANHNLTQGFSLAMSRSIAFFNRYLKS